MKTQSYKQFTITILLLWTTCFASASIVEPVRDDFEDEVDKKPRYYHTVKRSYISPENDVERYAQVPELEDESKGDLMKGSSIEPLEDANKRDLIKGPSIDPVITGTEDTGADQEYTEQKRVEEMHKNFYNLKPEVEETENGRRFSKIEHDKSKGLKSKKKKKISNKEKEEISEGLIKLLYDWKTQQGLIGSGSGERKHESKHGESKQDFSEDEDADTRNENEQAEIDTAMHEPPPKSKAAGNEIALGNEEEKDADDKSTEETDDAAQSGEGSDNKSKSHGKINVLVNVNINERSLRRSKVSRIAQKRMHFLKANKNNDNTEEEELVAKELSADVESGDDEDESGDMDDDETEESSHAVQPTNTNSTNAQQGYTSGSQNYSQSPAYATSTPQSNANAPQTPVSAQTPFAAPSQVSAPQISVPAAQISVPAPQIPAVQPASQVNFQPPQQQYQQSYSTNNNNNNNNQASPQTPYMALTYQPSPNTSTVSAATIEDDSSGEDDEEDLEEALEENESGSYSSGSGETRAQAASPAKAQTAQSSQRAAQIFFPGSMMTVTGKHEQKSEQEESSEEEDEVEEGDEHGSKEEGEEDTEEVDKHTAEQINEYQLKKSQKHHSRKNKKHKKIGFAVQQNKQESLGDARVIDASSKAIRKAKKQRHNPHRVTSTSDRVGVRPSEATKSKGSKIVNYKELESGRPTNTHFVKLQDAEGSKEDRIHLVKLHDSELRLLRQEKAKLAASEPIVIDDIKKKHLKPKPIPKEATSVNKTSIMAKFSSLHQQEEETKKFENIKPERMETKPHHKQPLKAEAGESGKARKNPEQEAVRFRPTTKRKFASNKGQSKPEIAAKPEIKVKPENAGRPEKVTKPELSAKPDAAAKLELKPDDDAKPELKPESAAKPELNPEAVTKAEQKPDAAAKPEMKPDTVAKPELEVKQENAGKPEKVAKPELSAKQDAAPRPELSAKSENVGKPETLAKSENDGKPELSGKPENEAKTELPVKPENEAKSELSSKSEDLTKTETNSKPEKVTFKPTTKRTYVTPNTEQSKPEVVVPLAEEDSDGKSTADKGTKTEDSDAGSGGGQTKKYGSLKLVRERFKQWEKEMISKLSNPYLKGGLLEEEDSGKKKAEKKHSNQTQTNAFSSWKDEEKDLINRLSNPYLREKEKQKKDNPIKSKGTHTAELSKNNQTDNNVTSRENLEKHENHTANLKNEPQKSSAKPQEAEEPVSELPINEDENDTLSHVESEAAKLMESSATKEAAKSSEDLKSEMEKKKTNYDQLEKFKKQITAEVGKINKLQKEYKVNLMQSNELTKAKETLNKDLASIKNIEKKIANEAKKKHGKGSKAKGLKMGMIPNPAKKKGGKDDPLIKIQALLQEEIRRTKSKKKKGHDKQLENIRGLLKNELTRLIQSGKLGSPNNLPASLKKLGTMIQKKLKAAKKKKSKKKKLKKDKKNPKILGNDLKNSFDFTKEYKPTVPGSSKNMITTKSSYKAAMEAMADLKEQQKQAAIEINGTDTDTSNSTATTTEWKAPAHEPTKPHVVMPAKLPTGPQTEQFKNLLQNLNKKIGEVYSRLQTGDKQKNNGNNQPYNGQPNNNGNNNGQQNNNGNNNGQANNNANNNAAANNNANNNVQNNNGAANNNANNYGQNNNAFATNNAQNNNAVPNNNIPATAPANNDQTNHIVPAPDNALLVVNTNAIPAAQDVREPMNYAMPQTQQPLPEQNHQNTLEAKNEMPDLDDDKEEPESDAVFAESEPVETLIENLEKDITDIWSYKERYPDAGTLGLDNDKIHQTYANLGSLSGLSLRRALNRALRGKDVGLAIVGGSISKGGPFSEKGVEYAVKAYFYAVADWWNKVIRPITGSSMIIRDVSIGGIATDYYSYCLRNHLPNDKLTNIVLWELAANDMRRYDDTIKPKPQSLEQFTQNVLSYKAKPALIFLNFFALFSWDPDLVSHCRNFEDEGENDIAKHYKITSLSWRDMVCSSMNQNAPLFTRGELFAEDQFHPSIEAHAQMAYVVIDYIRTEFLKNLVKQRFLEIGDAARRLKIPDTVYVPKPIYHETFTWKPVCYTYMMVDSQQPNNTLALQHEVNGDFQYTVLREFKVRSDKIIGMDTKKDGQYITYTIRVPPHPKGDRRPYKKLAIMSFTDDRQAEVRYDNEQQQKIDTAKKFLEGTVLKYVASNVAPGEHKLVIKSGPGGFVISAIMLG